MVRHNIALLNQETIDQIAAGEVIERPSSVVKEMTENAIDAGATAISIEIRDGGVDYIRITDNGIGIPADQASIAFMRHSTSKITDAKDLSHVHSLGFRGEALSSIAAVSRVEMITRPQDQLTGIRYVIEGGREVSCDEIGAPEGTTFIVRQLFYNTPARRKFLKSAVTESNYIADIVERLALSHPEVAFRLIVSGRERLATTGNGNLKDAVYQIYGRDVIKNLLEIDDELDLCHIGGFIGTPSLNRGNHSYENFFVNGRYVKSRVLEKAIGEGYHGFLMQHQFPFCVLDIDFGDNTVDVNVHPTKLDVRFSHPQEVYDAVVKAVHNRLIHREDIANVPVTEEKKAPQEHPLAKESGAEPFERKRLEEIRQEVAAQIHKDSPYEKKYDRPIGGVTNVNAAKTASVDQNTGTMSEQLQVDTGDYVSSTHVLHDSGSLKGKWVQPSFFTEEARKEYRIIGQLFDTYWLIEYRDSLYIIDQHAAHEKVMYEKIMATLKDKDMMSQMVSPPIIVTLNPQEVSALETYGDSFRRLGYVVEPFGGREYALTGVPSNLFDLDPKEVFLDMISSCTQFKGDEDSQLVLEKIASMSCKAAVKGNMHLSRPEIEQLITDLLACENPYHCPHGRPTIISISHYEMDKKFKRIVS